MTTVEIALPDTLAQEAQRAGLLAPEAIEEMLRQRLRGVAAAELRTMVDALAQSEITGEEMREIVAAVGTVRASR